MPETIWTSRREKKKKRLERVGGFSRGKVVPAEKITEFLQRVIVPGDTVILEGDNQKIQEALLKIEGQYAR